MTALARGAGPGPDGGVRDTGLFVYGLCRADLPVPTDLTGVDGAPIEVLVHGDLGAIVGRVALDRPPGRRQELLGYSQVLDTLASAGPVAPVAFGSIVADAEDLVATLLAPREAEVRALLEQLDGRVQMVLRATYVDDVALTEVVAADPTMRRLHERLSSLPPDAAMGDRLRLGQLVAHGMELARQHDAAQLTEAVQPLLADWVAHPVSGLERVLHLAMLVDYEAVPELEEVLEQWAEATHERMALELVGPVAAYDFVGGTGWA